MVLFVDIISKVMAVVLFDWSMDTVLKISYKY